ncbi:YggS family pyridoxal phosphate-dependent enzyme [Limnobacter humi]|uniref:Pyridoxal phosphate homeostasis protein n=1 Tax=Limnobacter humi TaxID=1778671 RepID=A0ABT1WGC6_9BURK|nr:YggS family pyridoxal phosphate-dependent enzyme [Limnobacter humi]MCQ8896569.1 YggS family pyridoxal phosphate-dependent enzyme [Limnobacter humi]
MSSALEQLTSIQQRIRIACERSGRDFASVQLLAVSKTFPAEAILDMATLGQTAFGENYLQEALDKITHLAELPTCPPLQWHFIGPIQSNKTRPIAEHFDWVHSVDRLKIAQRLAEQRPAHLSPLNVLIQINTSGEDSKSGVNPADAVALCQAVASLPKLRLRGLMTIPSPTENMEQLRGEFNICKTVFTTLNSAGLGLDTLSMGMSADLELAIECGSTCVRVGTALFGARH